MADDKSVVNSVRDIITDFLCKVPDNKLEAGSFNGVVHVTECGNGAKGCFTTIACAQEISIPEVEVETSLIEGGISGCDIFSEDIIFEEYTRAQTARIGDFTQSLYLTHDRLEMLKRLSMSKDPIGIVIELANKERTQFSFRAFLQTFSGSITARSDSGLAMIETMFKPTGGYLLTKNSPIKICK